jgi:hypothetical protein
MTNLDMNATSNSQWSTVNTDGFDSWNSKDIVIKNWVVTCGDVRPILISILFLLTRSFPGLYIDQRQQLQHPRLKRDLPRIWRYGNRVTR